VVVCKQRLVSIEPEGSKNTPVLIKPAARHTLVPRPVFSGAPVIYLVNTTCTGFQKKGFGTRGATGKAFYPAQHTRCPRPVTPTDYRSGAKIRSYCTIDLPFVVSSRYMLMLKPFI
jgi:hypothetical protein